MSPEVDDSSQKKQCNFHEMNPTSYHVMSRKWEKYGTLSKIDDLIPKGAFVNPHKTNMTMEKQPFEDVLYLLLIHGDFPLPC